ncbi:MAG: hypothetical protein Q9226_004063 [Calogaya cf. arnoldii]
MSAQQSLLQAASKNAELLQGLNETEYASSALGQSQAYLNDLDREIKACNSEVQRLESKTATELRDHKKYAESNTRRFLHRAMGKQEQFAEKASKEEREYVEALAAENQAKSQREEWIKTRDEARKRHGTLLDTDRTHKRLQAELDALYNSIFTGPSPEFPGEDEKETAMREAIDAFKAAKQRHEAELQAVNCLQEADRFMTEALRSLDDARSASRMDMLGGGTLSDMMERNALSKAQNATEKAKMLVQQARRFSPGFQGFGNINIAHGHVMSDIMFDNIFSDMAQHDRIKDSQAQAEREAQILRSARLKARERSDQYQQEATAALTRLETSRRELQQIRQDTFERLARSPTYDQAETPGGLDRPPSYDQAETFEMLARPPTFDQAETPEGLARPPTYEQAFQYQ